MASKSGKDLNKSKSNESLKFQKTGYVHTPISRLFGTFGIVYGN
jgi:hypothetical protein